MKLYILGQGNKYRINGGESTGKDYCSEFIAKYFTVKSFQRMICTVVFDL